MDCTGLPWFDRRWRTRLALVAPVALAAAVLASPQALAQPAASRTAPAAERYPDRPIRLLVGFAPGGGADTAARPVAQRLAEAVGQQVVVDNRPGSSGNVAAEIVARASPDGYSVLFGTIANFAINPMIYERLTYDPVRDFAPVTLAAAPVNVVVVHPSVQASTMKELIALIRAKPNTFNYGSSGIGGTGHLAGELMSLMGGLVMTHVPYKGGAPAMADLIGGNIPMVITVVPGAMPQVKAGRARLLAVTTGKRSSLLPDIPTIAESGLPGFEANNWYGVVVPAKTPQSIVARLNTELVKVLNSPGLRETYANQGIEAIPGTPAEFTAYIRSEIAKWGKIVKAAGIKAD
ncbi:MAG: tripartite tricarboxylate transporter substrate binding protein [Proteobacteria bacterium]|nr:tripartite tricarboxylate transporter substrate binding protein [Pseudomonadota bacterium]